MRKGENWFNPLPYFRTFLSVFETYCSERVYEKIEQINSSGRLTIL